MSRLDKLLVVALIVALVWNSAPTPPRQPLKSCPHCGAANEPDNTRCVQCHREI